MLSKRIDDTYPSFEAPLYGGRFECPVIAPI